MVLLNKIFLHCLKILGFLCNYKTSVVIDSLPHEAKKYYFKQTYFSVQNFVLKTDTFFVSCIAKVNKVHT